MTAPLDRRAPGSQPEPEKGSGVSLLTQQRWEFLTLGLTILAAAYLFVFSGLSALYNNLGCLAETGALLQAESHGRDALLNDAGQYLQAALRWDAENPWAYHNLGLIYLAWGQKHAAQDAFERAARLLPDRQPWNYHLGVLYDEQGQAAGAIAAWRKADAAPWLVGEGRKCQSSGDVACAERLYELAITVQPDCREAHYRLGVLYSGLGRKAEAAESYNRALALEPERSPDRYLIQARALALEARWEAAIAAYQRAIELNPYDAEPYEQIGALLLHQVQDVEGAIAWYLAASRVDPQLVGPHLALAGIYRAALDCRQAEHHYRQVLDLSQDSPFVAAQAQAGLSRCALVTGALEAAVQAAQAAVDAQPEVAAYHVLLGDVYAEMKQYGQAIDSYRSALALDPGNKQARRQLEALGWHEP